MLVAVHCSSVLGLFCFILLYKLIVSVCVQAGQRKLPDRFVKFFFGSYRFEYGDCQKNTKILYKLIN